uniref:Aspartokinase n=1 Tax=Chaetoceros debilis TaxID=122233 RepID=A0A7S3Q5Z4_9STRA|eukprot:CAMPEP_0194083036 /NCGR_PEP_ID=MMETSP0149-20130528/8387_1 /TAXON_ID=122233 /ORGANISM="Chaetoceros debilis, Strain MM31A-1" /LENGTH=534 /DNA_ID=CAMNT_0038765335 /DNA_START=61 /DNA_END=1665 /DNA_ORIENTATION=-
MKVTNVAICLVSLAASVSAFTTAPFLPRQQTQAVSISQHASASASALRMAEDETKSASEGAVKEFKSHQSEIRGKDRSETIDVTMKFGGSSLANADRIHHVTQLIKDQIALGYRPRAVICSAMGKTTNSLLSAGDFALEGRVNIDAIKTLHTAAFDEFDIAKNVREEVMALLNECEDMLNGVRLIQELSPKSLDQLVSYGERCSVRIVAARLNQIGVPAQAFDSWDIGMLTDSNFGDAKLLPDSEEIIKNKFMNRMDPDVVAVVTGFIGKDPNGKITTLGRGGSDLSATAIGAACQLDEIQVWKDVDGILSADPRLVKNAVPVDDVSYDEASELAYFGAQVLHPIAMQPAMKHDVPVRVKNSYNPSAVGTLIKKRDGPAPRLVTAITCKRNIQLLDIESTQMLGAYGFLANVFKDLEEERLSVDVLASSEVSVSLTLDKKQNPESTEAAVEKLSKYSNVKVRQDRAILTLITDVERSSECLATAFRVFDQRDIKIEMMSQGASKVNISFVLKNDQIEDAIIQLHSCFFEDSCIV